MKTKKYVLKGNRLIIPTGVKVKECKQIVNDLLARNPHVLDVLKHHDFLLRIGNTLYAYGFGGGVISQRQLKNA